MQENPYSGILGLISSRAKGQIPATFMFGEVKQANPLTVTVSDTDQSGSDLMKNTVIGELKAGDTVLLIPMENNQKFIVLCKVVGV